MASPYREPGERERASQRRSTSRPPPMSVPELLGLMWLLAIALALLGNAFHR